MNRRPHFERSRSFPNSFGKPTLDIGHQGNGVGSHRKDHEVTVTFSAGSDMDAVVLLDIGE